MHHIAYKLIRKPSNASRKKLHRSNEASRSASPITSEQVLQDREEITRLKVENERLKDNLECRENEIGILKEEIQKLEKSLKTDLGNSENHSGSSGEDDDGEMNGRDPPAGTVCLRNPQQEIGIMREALGSLRQCFNATDPHQHTIDTVEQTLSSLVERLESAQRRNHGHTDLDSNRETGSCLDSYSVFHGSGISSSFGLPVSSVDMSRSFCGRQSTKLVYYTSKSSTPFVSVIQKRLGEITLKDLKSNLDRPGQFRYHFKTLDPDYGMVKEEVVHDDAILPGWDDRIVAWIEKADE